MNQTNIDLLAPHKTRVKAEFELIDRINAAVTTCFKLAQDTFPSYRDAPYPIVEFFKESASKCGLAWGWTKLSFNLHVAAQNPDGYIGETIPHEVAHLVDSYMRRNERTKRGRGSHHGPNWKAICKRLGGSGTTRYIFDAEMKPAKAMPRYEYEASCGTKLWMTKAQHHMLMGIHFPRQTKKRKRLEKFYEKVQKELPPMIEVQYFTVKKTGGKIVKEGFTGRVSNTKEI